MPAHRTLRVDFILEVVVHITVTDTAIPAVVAPQGRLAVKSASRGPLPDLDCLVPTAADKHGSVGAPRNRRDNTMKYSTVSRITRLFTRMGNFLEKITLSARSTATTPCQSLHPITSRCCLEVQNHIQRRCRKRLTGHPARRQHI